MTRLSVREPIQATPVPFCSTDLFQDLGACKGTTDAVRGLQSPLAPEGGASRRSFRRAQTIRAGAQKRKRGLSFGPGLAQDASGVRELVGEGRWLCGFFSCSLWQELVFQFQPNCKAEREMEESRSILVE